MTPQAIAVVIPARNEAKNISRCLASVLCAAEEVAPILTLVVVVDDASQDATSEVVHQCLQHSFSCIGRTDTPNVGRARALGVDWALQILAEVRQEVVWLAFTDADTVVPVDWLARQVRWAQQGAHAVAGIVTLPSEEVGANESYASIYAAGLFEDHHLHVHGANMGMTARAYLEAGGFRSLTIGEDVELWNRVIDTCDQVVSDPHLAVETSARRTSHIEGGLATYLRQLATIELKPHRTDGLGLSW